jgi:cytochrome c oxidase assembly factor CtaG
MSVAYAHGVEAHARVDWNFEPWIVLPLLALAILYGAGSSRLAARGRTLRHGGTAAFWTGFLVISLALVSPLHEYGERVFALHMVEHELLMVVAVPLMVAARPGAALLWGLPHLLRGRVIALLRSRAASALWRSGSEIASATALHAAVLWFWHVPVAFQAALRSEPLHVVQHLSFILSAVLFWVPVLDRTQRRHGEGAAVLALFATSLHAGLLGALLTFSPRLWYPTNGHLNVIGLTSAEDQALAGLIMWVPACTLYVLAALALMARWLIRLEQRHA